MSSPRPFPTSWAVARVKRLLLDPSNKVHGYVYASGGYYPVAGIPTAATDVDEPWSVGPTGAVGADCAALPCFAYGMARTRPGFNDGPWATVSGDLNGNSMQEDGDHAHELFMRVYSPEPGDVLAYSTITIREHVFIGHVAMVLGTDRAGDWDPKAPQYWMLDIAQICGPQGRSPACIATDGGVFDRHDLTWPKSKCSLLRVVP